MYTNVNMTSLFENELLMIERNVMTCLNIQTNNLDLDSYLCCALFQETNIREVNDITSVEQSCCFRLLEWIAHDD